MTTSVTKGASVKEILDPRAPFDTRFIKDLEHLKVLTQSFQQFGYKVVLTQGVFDLIHEGHGKYLELAKAQGDVLIVGVDTDDLTRHRKGPSRPVVPEGERLRMLTLLRSVDIVALRTIPQALDDIDYFVKAIRPDVLVMSVTTKDFPVEKKTEMEKFVGEVVIFEPQAETSSTARIRKLTIEGVDGLLSHINKFVDDLRGKS